MSFIDLEGFEELNVVGVKGKILVDILDIRILVETCQVFKTWQVWIL
ncbi:hypothetical protein [Belliella pelovolcani]|nr:hypothetical protein [Belliella pelovolcani]